MFKIYQSSEDCFLYIDNQLNINLSTDKLLINSYKIQPAGIGVFISFFP